ncbi:MAG: hypothetical protein ACRD9Y_06095 [Blastocatellia bacterium]
MKLSLSLLLTVLCFFIAAPQQARADVYGLSVIAYDNDSNIYGYGLTEITDLEIRYYYDAGVDSYLFDGDTGAVLDGDFALGYGYAEVYSFTPGFGEKPYGMLNDHYLGGYFQYYEGPILYTLSLPKSFHFGDAIVSLPRSGL